VPDVIGFYFDFISPYSYLAHTQLPRIVERHRRRIEYHPVDLNVLKVKGGNTGPASREQPLKFRYVYSDFARWSARYGVPMKRLGGYDPKLRLTKGTFLALDRGQAQDYVTVTWRRIWGEGGSLGDEALMRGVARELGWKEDEFLSYLVSEAAEERLRAATEAAHARGVFGVPTMTIGAEMWWGNDRLDFLEEYLAAPAAAHT
jgi:2-hydroxychromene-2-carboxylate isomerase